MTKFEIEQKKLQKRIKKIIQTSERPIALFKRIWRDQQAQSAMMFRRLAHGGTYRGVRWRWFSDQYTRKTDGAVVPAEGGVPRLRGDGVVQGRLRPSGQRIDGGSNLLRDTGLLRTAVASAYRIRGRGRILEIITPLRYAAPQQARRPFTFFTRGDATRYSRWAGEELIRDQIGPQ